MSNLNVYILGCKCESFTKKIFVLIFVILTIKPIRKILFKPKIF